MRPRHRFVTLIAATLLVLAACGGDDGAEGEPDRSTTTTAAAPSTIVAPDPDKPDVEPPGVDPAELTRTEIVAGSGPEASTGSTVVVDYVGVRSVDGVEFDSSWDRGRPYTVILGQGSIIEGWEQGLLGVQAGGRYQLDIPPELAYGDRSLGEVIQPNTSLTFLIDVRAVFGPTDPSQAPTDVPLDPLGNVEELIVEDLVVGEGRGAELGDLVAIHVLAYRADDGGLLSTSWESNEAIELQIDDGVPALEGLIDGLKGMQTGGRRLIHVPYEQLYGGEGNADLGLPPETDMIFIVDLMAIY